MLSVVVVVDVGIVVVDADIAFDDVVVVDVVVDFVVDVELLRGRMEFVVEGMKAVHCSL